MECPYRVRALRALLKQYVLNYRDAYKMRLSDIAEERSSTVEALERQSFEDEIRMVKQGSLSTRFSLYRKRMVGTDALESYREARGRSARTSRRLRSRVGASVWWRGGCV